MTNLYTIPSNSLSALMAGNPDGAGLRDIKPPVDIPSFWIWVIWGAAALAVAALAYLGWRWWQKQRQQALVLPPIPAHIRARQKLEEALELISKPKPFCIQVSDTIRFYLEERFEFHAPDRTTEEFLQELRGTDLLSPEQKESLGEFLKSCDLVKFARYEPREAELRELHASAVRLVDETKPRPPAPPAEGDQTADPKPELAHSP